MTDTGIKNFRHQNIITIIPGVISMFHASISNLIQFFMPGMMVLSSKLLIENHNDHYRLKSLRDSVPNVVLQRHAVNSQMAAVFIVTNLKFS